MLSKASSSHERKDHALVFHLVRNLMALPQGLTFDSAQKFPEVAGDDPCRAALKTRASNFTFPVHRPRENPGSAHPKDNCCSGHPAGGTQGCSGAIPGYEKQNKQTNKTIKKNMHNTLSLEFLWNFQQYQMAFSSFFPLLISNVPALSHLLLCYISSKTVILI